MKNDPTNLNQIIIDVFDKESDRFISRLLGRLNMTQNSFLMSMNLFIEYYVEDVAVHKVTFDFDKCIATLEIHYTSNRLYTKTLVISGSFDDEKNCYVYKLLAKF